ncbi:MAG TPA: flippase [Methanomicrobia archaeon]|nr:flippase [Methanomicrobia archaeon]
MIARKSTLIIITHLLNGLLGYIALKFIALYMEPWEYGVVGFAYGFVALFSFLSDLGFNAAHIKRVSEGRDLETCIATFAVTKLALAGLMASVVIGSLAVWKYVVGNSFETPYHESAVYILLASFLLLGVTRTMIFTFNARQEIAKSQLPHFVATLARVVATIVVAYLGWGALALAYTYLFGELFQFSLALFFFRNYSFGRPSADYFRDYLRFARPMALASAAYIIMTSMDKVFIQFFWGATQVGEYFAVFNLSHFVLLFVYAVGTLLFPAISEYHAINNIEGVRKLFLQSERYLSMIVFPLVVLLAALAEPVIHILISDQYLPAVQVLRILPFFVVLETLSLPYVSNLQGMNEPQKVRNRVIIMLILNITLNLVLIPQELEIIGLQCAGLGALGAAIATVVAYFVGLIYIKQVALKLIGIKGSGRIMWHVIAAALMGAIVLYTNNIMAIGRWYELLGIVVGGLLLYFVLLVVFREFTREDLDFFLYTLNIRELFRYLNEELRGR